MSTPASAWPKPYLLEIYSRAVAEGCIRVRCDSEARAKSLILSFYRLRRRSDKQHVAFIRPEYHLVTGTWEPDRGTVLFTYSSLPDGSELPPIESVSQEERQQLLQPKVVEHKAEAPQDEVDIEKLMADMIVEAGERLKHDL